MKNTLIIVVLAIGLTCFFGFTATTPIATSNSGEYAAHNTNQFDTIPAKKDTSKWKSKKTPYDLFGKPKTMDSIQIR